MFWHLPFCATFCDGGSIVIGPTYAAYPFDLQPASLNSRQEPPTDEGIVHAS